MKIIKNIEQGSKDWLDLRLGKVTASNFDCVLAKGKSGGVSKTRQSYLYQLAAERITGLVADSFKNQYMEWGIQNEPVARSFYELDQNIDTEIVSFVLKNEDVGASPDSLVGDKGLLEIKCPKTTTQIEYFLNAELPSEYRAQIQGQLWVTERDWCDFVSFDPRINSGKKYFRLRIFRDEKYISELATAVDVFVDELKTLVNKLEN